MISLSQKQCRVIGVMLEKETTTPEQYPLSINGLTNGCNQKSNREPVMSLSEHEVQDVVDELVGMNQLMLDRAGGGRVNKYMHRFCNTAFGGLQFTAQQRAIICVLLLRGPQTPGELRTRTNRLADFTDVSEVEATLKQLQDHNGDAMVKKLAREPGKRESRYIHLFAEFDESEYIADTGTANSVSTDAQSALADRVETLEQQVSSLMQEIENLKQRL